MHPRWVMALAVGLLSVVLAGCDVSGSSPNSATQTPTASTSTSSGPVATTAAATSAPAAVAPPTTAPPQITSAPAATAPPTATKNLCGAPENPYGYNFCGGNFITNPPGDFCTYFNCIASFDNGKGYVVECQDGMFSKSGGRSGSCSSHGGNKQALFS